MKQNLQTAFEEMVSWLQVSLPTGSWFLEAGTCLGMVRDNGIIEHDKDVDFGILAESFDFSLVRKIVKETSFFIYSIHGYEDCGLEVRFKHPNGTKVDWFLFYKRKYGGQEVRWAAAYTKGGMSDLSDMFAMPFPARMIETHSEAFYNGIPLPIPSDTENYLLRRYGETWRVPDKNWNWAKPFCRDDELTKLIVQEYAKR